MIDNFFKGNHAFAVLKMRQASEALCSKSARKYGRDLVRACRLVGLDLLH